MSTYTVAVGTHDPDSFPAATAEDAVREAVTQVRRRFSAELETNPQEVVTLLGPNGLVTRSGERLDEFLGRSTNAVPTGDPDQVQPGDSNTPDCNGD